MKVALAADVLVVLLMTKLPWKLAPGVRVLAGEGTVAEEM